MMRSTMERSTVGCSRLAPVREEMQMRARDSAAYYSCDDHFVVVDKTVDYGRGVSMSDRSSGSEVRAKVRPLDTSTTAHMAAFFCRTWSSLWSLHGLVPLGSPRQIHEMVKQPDPQHQVVERQAGGAAARDEERHGLRYLY